jgi:chromosome segregation ATPase
LYKGISLQTQIKDIKSMNSLNNAVIDVESKVEKLLKKFKKSEEEKSKLEMEMEALKKQLNQQKEVVEELKAKNTLIKLAKSLNDTNEKSSDVKLKINQLVREIDRCIALLSSK